MWKNIVELSRPHVTIWRMRIACWINKATHHTHTKNIQYSLLLHSNNGCTNAPQYYVIRTRTLRVLLVNLVVSHLQRVMHYLFVCYGCLGLHGRVFTLCHFANHKHTQYKQYLEGEGIEGWEFQHAEEWLGKK
jgi:hypothetical protein